MFGLISIMIHPVNWWRHRRRYLQWVKDTGGRWDSRPGHGPPLGDTGHRQEP